MDGEKPSVERLNMEFRHYKDKDYDAVCDFLIALNRDDKSHINWNWARFEWMAEHPEFDKSLRSAIGLWRDEEKVVGAAIYDMYFGEAFCGVLPEHEALYPEILDYAYRELRDDNGLGIAICDESVKEINVAKQAGFSLDEQTETVISIGLNDAFPVQLSENYRFTELDPTKEPYAFQWLLWQGFNHGTEREAFEKSEPIVPQIRRHLDPRLSVAVENADGEKVAYCCLWYSDKTDYAYVEPVCTIPSCRGKGIAKALLYEALDRVKARGAKKAYVISDTEFYQKLGFKQEHHYTFYRKKG